MEKSIETHIEKGDEAERRPSKVDVPIHSSEVLANQDLLYEAYEGEKREHAMGLWEAAKTHPKACLWAFIMCFTIVSILPSSS
jgi:MFS transporter, SP family, general alpha glucoside:H+ symporter